jgi:hypothetical protein
MESNKVKGFVLACCFLLLAASAHAQTFAEWFEQGKTQIKYLTQQIAALNAFETSVKQGYHMAKNELGAIGNWKNGEFTLHQDYYHSLSQVNPLVKSSTDMNTIQSETQSIISQFNSLYSVNGLSASEQTYLRNIGQNMVTECNNDLNELQTVLTPGQLMMSDDERINRISKVTESIKDKYVFTCSFCTQVRVLAAQRNSDGNDNEALQKLYGINP